MQRRVNAVKCLLLQSTQLSKKAVKMMKYVENGCFYQCLLLFVCLLCVPRSAQAQAWDGEGDVKVYAGYANVGRSDNLCLRKKAW